MYATLMHTLSAPLEVTMRRNQSSYRKAQVVALTALAFVVAAPAAAFAAGNEGSERRMELAMTSRSSGSARTERMIAENVMAYRFSVESAPSGAWSVTVRIAGSAGVATLELSNEAPEIVLPRPLGLLLKAGDTLSALARYDTDGVEEAVRLHIDHEASDRSGSRLAIRPVRADAHSSSGDTAASWRLTPDVSGRVLALAGLPMQRVRTIALTDEVSGETLWSTTLDHKASRAYCPALPRLGAQVEAGRAYRVDVVFTEYVPITHLTGAVAMVLPQLIAKQ